MPHSIHSRLRVTVSVLWLLPLFCSGVPRAAFAQPAGGEGMIGVSWAFFVAGCPTTVVSQWSVEVNSTTELMVEFHKGLKPGIEGRSSNVSKAGALRAAVLKLMKKQRYRHPFYWAPFVVIGDGR